MQEEKLRDLRVQGKVLAVAVLGGVLSMTVSLNSQEKRGDHIPPEEMSVSKGQPQKADRRLSLPPATTSKQSIKFRIYRSDAEIGPYALIDSVDFEPGETSFAYRDTTARYTMVYWYIIGAVDDVGLETWSEPESGIPYNLPPPPSPPGPPDSLVASDTPDDEGGSITLTWSKSPDDSIVTSYYIYRSWLPGVGFGCIDSVSAGVATYADSPTRDGDSLYYLVRAHNGINGSNSNEASGVSRDNLAPLPPMAVTATPEVTGILLTWFSNSERDLWGYRVYRGTESGTGYTLTSDRVIPDTTYLDTNVSPFMTYYYVVTALDRASPSNESSYSHEVRAQLRH